MKIDFRKNVNGKQKISGDIVLKDLNKIYPGGVQALFDFNLKIKKGEFIVFVGPSGCGKSTTLRMIAGLEEISYGTFKIGDTIVNSFSPKDRGVAMVFQNYALYPHMNVKENMSFGLKVQRTPKLEIEERVNNIATMLGIEDFLNRYPKDLSGGQRQRVALGRAIIKEPEIFLMDEPLSNLDAKLRGEMRKLIVSIQKKIKVTTIYVTHDQIEAMTMADRIVVMSNGLIQQVDTPENIFSKPANLFVAKFIGTPEMNTIEGAYKDGKFTSTDGVTSFELGASNVKMMGKFSGSAILGVRSIDVYLDKSVVSSTFSDTKTAVVIESSENFGDETIWTTKEGISISMPSASNFMIDIGKKTDVYFNKSRIHIFDKKTGVNLLVDVNEDTLLAKKKNEANESSIKFKEELMEIQKNKGSGMSFGSLKNIIKKMSGKKAKDVSVNGEKSIKNKKIVTKKVEVRKPSKDRVIVKKPTVKKAEVKKPVEKKIEAKKPVKNKLENKKPKDAKVKAKKNAK